MKQESEKCQLSEAELRGFVAEAEIDAGGDVAYVDHIKRLGGAGARSGGAQTGQPWVETGLGASGLEMNVFCFWAGLRR